MLVPSWTLVLCQAGSVEGGCSPFTCAHEKQTLHGHEPSPPFSMTFSLKAQKQLCEWPFIISSQDCRAGAPTLLFAYIFLRAGSCQGGENEGW